MSDTPETEAQQFDALVAAQREPVADAPAPAAEATPPNPDTVAATPSDEIDLSTLPPSVRARIERAAELETTLQRERNERLAAVGRISPLNREVDNLRKQLAQLQGAPASPPAASPAAGSTAAAPAPGSPKWDQFARAFPEDAAAILEREEQSIQQIAALKAELAEVRKALPNLDEFNSHLNQQKTERELAALTEAHPDWQELVLAADASQGVNLGPAVVTPIFAEWLASQDEDVQAWFGSPSAAKNIRLLDNFKRDMALADRLSNEPVAHEASPEAAAAAKRHEQRTQARASSVAPDLRGQAPSAARVDLSSMTEEQQFAYHARRMAERRNQLRQQGR